MLISYNWLKWYIEGELPPPEKLVDILTFKLCEVEGIEKRGDDIIFDLNILPNRAHDLLSHQGVAREIAGIIGLPFKDPTPLYNVPESQPTKLAIHIETPTCRRYLGRVVRNITVGPSPDWVVQHLESIGQRSINNIVDATNLVMYDCGQPCHAFDAEKITNPPSGEASYELRITNASEGETFGILGKEQSVVTLQQTDMVIADGAGKTLALAGVKGGLSSGVTEKTKDIILEVANFSPVAVRKTARRLGLLSDSAKRFENDLSPERATYGMLELSGLILEMCPEASFEDVVDIYPIPQEKRVIAFSVSRINTYLGTNISENEMITLLQTYGYHIEGANDQYALTVPELRLDLEGMHDIAEDVLRLYGLEKITPELPLWSSKPTINEQQYQINAVRKFFTEEEIVRSGTQILPGVYREVMTYTFRKKGVFEVLRGVGDKGALRTNLSDGLKESYELNRLQAPLLEIDEIKIFEIGAVFPKEGEVIHVGWADKKGVYEMELGTFCITHRITLGDSYEAILSIDSIKGEKFSPWSQYPFIARDIALWVPEGVTSDEVEQVIRENAGDFLVRGPRLFDTFTKPASPVGGEGKTSYAFRMVFQSSDRTLTDEDILSPMENIAKVIHTNLWEIR